MVSARSARVPRSSSQSGKCEPVRSLGIAWSKVPVRVSNRRWRWALRELVRSVLRWPQPAPHSASASGPHQSVDEQGEHLAQHIRAGAGESVGQHRRQIDIVDSGHRVYSFARVTLDGLSKNHAMTLDHSATTRR